MAWDLWGSSYDQVACDVNYSEHPEWKCDFYFGCDRDLIEEDALNEGYCVQVLRILITKADTEIEELEKDLLSLQNELAWTEHENWPEICFSALTERINMLDVAISALKKDHADEVETRLLLLHNKPVETLSEIVKKALQGDHCQHTNDQLTQLQDANILNSITNATKYAPDKESNNIDSNIVIKEERKELGETSESSRSSDLQLAPLEKRPADAEKELLPKDLVRSPDLGDISCSPGHSDGMKLSGTSDDGVIGNEIRKSQLIATDTGQILTLLSAKENGNVAREVKSEVSPVKENHVTSDALRPATGIKGRKKGIDSSFGVSQQRKGRNSDFDRKLSEFALKAAQRACKKESKVAPAEELDSVSYALEVVYPPDLCPADTELCSFKGGNGNTSPQAMNIQNTSLMRGENSTLISLLEMQAKSVLRTGLRPTDEEKPLAQGGPKMKIATSLIKSNMTFPSKPKTQRKRKSELETFSTGEPHEGPKAVTTNTSSIVSTKRQRKSTIITEDASSNDSMNSNMTKRAVQPGQHETEVRAIVPYDSEFSELQKKRRASKLPITIEINSNVKLDIPNPNTISTDVGSLVSSLLETSCSLPEALKKFNMHNLKAIAKEHNVKKYHKLTKAALIELLAERLSNL